MRAAAWVSARVLTLAALLGPGLFGQAPAINLKAIPFPCAWVNPPKEFKAISGNALSILAANGTDLYNDCGGTPRITNAPMLVFEPDPQFVLTAAVAVEFQHEFDGGFLVLYADENHWGKLLFEKSHGGPLSVCSAVTSTFSDDTVNTEVTAKKVWLRLARTGDKVVFYLSQDGKRWNYLRYFRFPGKARVGFAAQSPDGRQCRAVFSQIRYSPEAPKDFWSGE